MGFLANGDAVARPFTNEPHPRLLANEECPLYPTEEDAPARVGARVMERVSPRELWRMATTG